MLIRLTALIAILLQCVTQPGMAVTFRAEIEQSQWQIEASPFFCRLQQVIPAFGTASFFHEAGERALFSLEAAQSQALAGPIRLVAEASPWQPGSAPRVITQVNPQKPVSALPLDADATSDMLLALYRGMFPTFTLENWLGSGESARVAVSAVNFQRAYREYLECVQELLPVNYRQVARTAVLFPPAGWQLSDATRERLDLIALYIKADEQVGKVYVDGHSDNAGRRLLNRDLSKQRAEEVTRYLVSQGVDPKKITTRYHGERYPVVANNSKANRARNRRVAIRLTRESE